MLACQVRKHLYSCAGDRSSILRQRASFCNPSGAVIIFPFFLRQFCPISPAFAYGMERGLHAHAAWTWGTGPANRRRAKHPAREAGNPDGEQPSAGSSGRWVSRSDSHIIVCPRPNHLQHNCRQPISIQHPVVVAAYSHVRSPRPAALCLHTVSVCGSAHLYVGSPRTDPSAAPYYSLRRVLTDVLARVSATPRAESAGT